MDGSGKAIFISTQNGFFDMGVNKNIKKRNSSFTLIEMIVVVGIIAFVMPVVFSIVFVIFQQQARIYNLQEVKRQGDNTINTIQNTVKLYGSKIVDPTANPTGTFPTIIDICPQFPTPSLSPRSYLFLYDKSNTAFSYVFKDDSIASSSPSNNIIDLMLTNKKVVISNVKFSCSRSNQFSPAVVGAEFDVSRIINGETAVSMHYNTRFKLTNY